MLEWWWICERKMKDDGYLKERVYGDEAARIMVKGDDGRVDSEGLCKG